MRLYERSLSLSRVTAGPERRQIGPVLVVFIINRTVRQGSDQDAVPAPRHLAAPAKHAGMSASLFRHVTINHRPLSRCFRPCNTTSTQSQDFPGGVLNGGINGFIYALPQLHLTTDAFYVTDLVNALNLKIFISPESIIR